MKKIFVLAATALLLGSSAVMAQQGPGNNNCKNCPKKHCTGKACQKECPKGKCNKS